MISGERASYNGREYCLFPLAYANCTQRGIPGDMSLYSHCCTYACDWGPDTNPMPVYAPFSGTLVYQSAANGRRYFHSDSQVWTPLGPRYVTLELVHDNNPPAAGHYNQGDLIYHTGTAGNVTGAHVHIDQAPARDQRIANSGYACRGSSTGACWTLPDTAPAYDIFYMTGSETIVNLRGMTFQTVPVRPVTGKMMLLLMAAWRKRKNEHHNTRIIRL